MAMLLLQATVAVVPEMTPPVNVTPAFLTKPVELHECRMVGTAGDAFNLTLRKEGERGFDTDQVVGGERITSRTAPFFRILNDASGHFSGMKYISSEKPGLFSNLFRDEAGNSARFESWDSDGTGEGMLRLKYYSAGSRTLQVFAGPCKVTKTPQTPLDRDPTKGAR